MKSILLMMTVACMMSCNGSGQNNTSSDSSATDATASTTGGETNAITNSDSFKKYDVKSGTVYFDVTSTVAGMVVKTTEVLYFDDYGNKECIEKFEKDPVSGKDMLSEATFCNGGFHYNYTTSQMEGAKTKNLGYGVAARFDMKDANDDLKKDLQYKELPSETIAGQTCDVITIVTPSGNSKVYGWNHIVLRQFVDNPQYKIKNDMSATKIDLTTPIPAGKFDVPANVKFTAM